MSVGERAAVTPELLDVVRSQYQIAWRGAVADLGGSVNLNLHLPDANGGFVARVYCPWTSPDRLNAIQAARAIISENCLPIPETIRTRDGAAWLRFGDRAIEVERYVPGENMDARDQLARGMRALARMHDAWRDAVPHDAAREAPYANYVDATRALEWTLEAVERRRQTDDAGAETRLCDLALTLASELDNAQDELAELPRQLVHGDFWDNNVLFRDTEIVAVLDFDFMGVRARIEDVALILCYLFTSPTFRSEFAPSDRIARLRAFVDAYDAGLRTALSRVERSALPLALARNVLPPFCNLWRVRDETTRNGYARQMTHEFEWALELVASVERWQSGLS